MGEGEHTHTHTYTLKPCPFCGCDAGIGTVTYDQESDTAKLNGQRTFRYVNCIACGVNNRGLVGFQSKAEAIEAWNHRALHYQLAEALKKLKFMTELSGVYSPKAITMIQDFIADNLKAAGEEVS